MPPEILVDVMYEDLVEILIDKGWNTKTVTKELGASAEARSDDNIFKHAQKTRCVVVTVDGNFVKRLRAEGLALKRNALTSVPCVPFDLAPLYCSSVDSGWNVGTSTATWSFMLLPGHVDFYSSVCLDQSTHHSSVDFEMDTVRKITSIFGTVMTSENQYDLNFSSENQCSYNELTQWVQSTNTVSTLTSISNISLN